MKTRVEKKKMGPRNNSRRDSMMRPNSLEAQKVKYEIGRKQAGQKRLSQLVNGNNSGRFSHGKRGMQSL